VSFDDDAAESFGHRPPPHPDDRLWRHPSELAASRSPVVHPRHRGLHWGAVAALGTASVVLAGAAALLVGVRSPADVDGALQQQASVTRLVPETTATTSTLVTPTPEPFLDDSIDRLGIEVRDRPTADGVAIAAVDPDGPAADSGLGADDVIVGVEGTVVTDLSTLTGALADHDDGDIVEVVVQPADGTEDPVTIELEVGALADVAG
jgi:S1-C subfamily serine protease